MNDKISRVRFAPSPTGQLHLGGARTALFNWLYARKNNGKFLLRIEDTDKVRSKQKFTDQILDSLKWLGLEWDEDIIYQSARKDIYKKPIKYLLDQGKAYHCFCAKEKIAEERKKAELKGRGYIYSGTCRHLDKKTVQEKLAKHMPFSVRVLVPEGYTEFVDNIYGKNRIDNKEIDDFIIARTDGSPVYNFVVTIDDNAMNITNVIRGEDHISNTPKQILIYQAMNYSIPEFSHLPMILGPDKKRLSKRHGATGVQEYREYGYLAGALINYLALLGWNPGTEQELFSKDELIRQFTISRVQKKSAVFDEKKLQWMSGQHIYRKSNQEIMSSIRTNDPDWYVFQQDEYILNAIELMKERVKSLNDMQEKIAIFFEDPPEYEEKAARKKWKDESVNRLMTNFEKQLARIEKWDIVKIENTLRNLADSEKVSPGQIIHPTRLAVSGTMIGPSLFGMMGLLGKETCIRRIKTALAALPLKAS